MMASRSPRGDLSDNFDDDLLSAALLFLDKQNEVSDTDSISDSHTDSDSSHSRRVSDPDQYSDHEQRLEPSLEPEPLEQPSGACVGGMDLPVVSEVPRTKPAPVKLAPAAAIVLDAMGNPVRIATQGHTFRPLRRHRVNKQKVEIDVLRLEVETLQARIQELQVQPDAVTPQNVGLLLSAALGSTWKNVAAQQQQRLERSEAENRRLKVLLADHRRIAKSLRRIAVRHINSKSWIPIRPPPIRSVESHTVSELEDPAIFQMLHMSLEQMLEQTESALVFSPGRILHSERHGDSHFTVKIQDSRCVPFGLAKTAAAMWDHTLFEEDIQNLQYTAVADGAVQSKFVSYVDLGDIHGLAEGKLVVKRVDEPDRTVIVRHSLFHCLAVAHKNRFLALPIHHFLWIVIDRPPEFGKGRGQDMISRIRRCAVTLPRLDTGDGNDPMRDKEIKELLRMNKQVATQLCDQACDAVDNLLMGTGAPLGTKMIPWQAAVEEGVVAEEDTAS